MQYVGSFGQIALTQSVQREVIGMSKLPTETYQSITNTPDTFTFIESLVVVGTITAIYLVKSDCSFCFSFHVLICQMNNT